jgi:hypothetical protein
MIVSPGHLFIGEIQPTAAASRHGSACLLEQTFKSALTISALGHQMTSSL